MQNGTEKAKAQEVLVVRIESVEYNKMTQSIGYSMKLYSKILVNNYPYY